MARSKNHNPERRAWKGKSHKKGGVRVRSLREKADLELAVKDKPPLLVVGQKVESIGYWAGITGEIMSIELGYDDEDHGTIEIKVTALTPAAAKKNSWLSIGDYEHFVYHNWEKSLRLLNK